MPRTQKHLLDDLEEVSIFAQEPGDIEHLMELCEECKREIERMNTVETNLRATIDTLRAEIDDLNAQIDNHETFYKL